MEEGQQTLPDDLGCACLQPLLGPMHRAHHQHYVGLHFLISYVRMHLTERFSSYPSLLQKGQDQVARVKAHTTAPRRRCIPLGDPTSAARGIQKGLTLIQLSCKTTSV